MKTIKPISIRIEGNRSRASFDIRELRQYLETTDDEILWVEDEHGRQAPFRVEFLRQALDENKA